MKKVSFKAEARCRPPALGMTHGILVADVKTGRFSYANSAICGMLGYAETELLRMGIADIHPRESLDQVAVEFGAMLRGEKTLSSGLPCLRKDGTVFYADIAEADPIIPDGGSLAGIFTDVSDRKRLEDELKEYRRDLDKKVHERTLELARVNAVLRAEIDERKKREEENRHLERQLRQALKMEVMGTMAGGMAHNFNNILSAISGYSELALLRTAGDEKAKRYLRRVFDSAQQAKMLVRRVLSFSHPELEGEKKPLSFTPIIEASVKHIRSTLPTTVEIALEIHDDGEMVCGNSAQLRQVMMNLVSNACDALGETGGRIEVALSGVRVPVGDPSLPCAVPPGHYLCLTVKDRGHGIAAAHLDRIFDPFFTTKKTGAGMGLGLSVVHGIVKAHRGFITVDSERGKGTAFVVYLPVIEKKRMAL